MSAVPTYHHEVALYRSDDDLFGAGAGFFAQRCGGDTVISVSGRRSGGSLGSRLGWRTDVMEIDEQSTRPSHVVTEVLKRLSRFDGSTTERGCLVCQLAPQDPEAWRSWILFEIAINMALRAAPVDILCAYDIAAAPAGYADLLGSAHFHLGSNGAESLVNPGYRAPLDVMARQGPAPPYPLQAERPLVTLDDVSSAVSVRHAAVEVATPLLDRQTLNDFEVAVGEVTTNALRHGEGRVDVSVWADADMVVVSVHDEGQGPADHTVGMVPPAPNDVGGFGLWIARNWSDSVEVLEDAGGCAVRLMARREMSMG